MKCLRRCLSCRLCGHELWTDKESGDNNMIANFIRLIVLLVLILQDSLLNFYFATYNGVRWLWWIAADVAVVVCLIASFIYADRYFVRHEKSNEELQSIREAKKNGECKPTNRNVHKKAEGDKLISESDIAPDFRAKEAETESTGEVWDNSNIAALPIEYLIWLPYALVHVSKITAIYTTFGPTLDKNETWGTTMLDVALTLTAVFFAFLVTTTHHKVPTSSEQKGVIRWMQNHAILDILDTVEILGYLFENQEQLSIDKGSKAAVLTFVSINLLLPLLSLYQLSERNCEKKKPNNNLCTIQQLLSSLFGNLPFLVIRIYLWHSRSHAEGSFIFVLKNSFGIANNSYDFYKLVQNSRRPPEMQEDDAAHRNPAVTCEC
ncbi:hypothetical protein RvY_16880 [Ramazzottius varieornatus]|uniref:Uncharacterized protein n=1 Tax=Ramazzottius varieornatus TaxID=947166 RepID=A0A1D1W128_RAMVA|nr:hypothetical protein RvY_16880 [Ramazzottius varieornatus]